MEAPPNDHQISLPPPPCRRNIPRPHSGGDGGRNRCLKCIYLCSCLLFFLVVTLFFLIYFLYTFYNPQIPSYKFADFSVHDFDIKSDFSLHAEFIVIVKAHNPNENIDFIYGKNSHVSVFYSDSELCAGKVPTFRQPGRNLTAMRILLSGNSEFGSGLQEALMENRHSGKIPLLVEVKVPVTVVIGEFPMKEINVLVNCSLVVDHLNRNKKVGILSTNYTYGATL